MKILIVEDDMVSRRFLQNFLSKYGECDVVVDGLEALDAFLIAMNDHKPYDLVCLDIMMPKVDGVKVLKAIRDLEKQKKILPEKQVKVIMTTALDDKEYVTGAFEIGCDAYAPKPISTERLAEVIGKLGLINGQDKEMK